jgi:hypothetical protein
MAKKDDTAICPNKDILTEEDSDFLNQEVGGDPEDDSSFWNQEVGVCCLEPDLEDHPDIITMELLNTFEGVCGRLPDDNQKIVRIVAGGFDGNVFLEWVPAEAVYEQECVPNPKIFGLLINKCRFVCNDSSLVPPESELVDLPTSFKNHTVRYRETDTPLLLVSGNSD